MKLKCTNWIIISLIFLTNQAYSQDKAPQKILFIGNSYTYFWNLPQQISLLANAGNVTIETRQSTVGGSNLGQHWRSDRGLKSVDLINEGDFDAIVLQDHSMRSIDHPDSLMYFGEKLANLAKTQKIKVYVYMTWAREFDPLMQASITKGYTALATKIDATLVPVGLAWQKARTLRPDLNLYDADGSHPSPVGSYLTACVFYAKLTGNSPVGLPQRLTSEDKDGEYLFLNVLPSGDALFCQKVAASIVFDN